MSHLKETVEIRAREKARIEASLKRVMGGILVVTDPLGANVSIDGRRAGVGPYGGKGLTPGKHKVRVDKEGYEPWEGEVTVIAEKDVEVPVALKLKGGELLVQSEPPGAKVYLTGKEIGDTPIKVSGITPGVYELRVIKEGYAPHEAQVKIVGGRSETVRASLRKSVGSLLLRTEPAGANVYIDGKLAGVSPLQSGGLIPGTHRVQISKEAFETQEKEVIVKANERAEVSISLKRTTGALVIQTDPPGANVSIDGRRAGVSPYGGKGLTPGKHKVRVDKEGYETWEGEVTVIAEKDVEVPVALKLKGGELLVQSEPPGAKVYLTGKEIGDTPIKVSGITPGVYELRVIKGGYAPHEAQVKIVGGRSETVRVSLSKSVGSLLFRTEPAGANVYIDGKLAGVSPLRE